MKKLLAVLLACCLGLLCGCARGWNPFAAHRYLEVNGEEISRPSWQDVKAAIEGLDDSEDSYVYLELGEALDGVWYLSAALPLKGYEDGLGYIVEACAGQEGDYRYYESRTTDTEAVLDCFEDFFRGRGAPDVTGWEDITDWYSDDYGDDSPFGYDAPYHFSDGAVPI